MTTPSQPSSFELRATKIATGSEDERGVLVFVGEFIVAILIRLDASFYESAKGSWYLEVGFGACEGVPEPFERLSDGLLWIADRLGMRNDNLSSELAEADRIFDATSGEVPGSP